MIYDLSTTPVENTTYEKFWETNEKCNNTFDVTACSVEILRARSYEREFKNKDGNPEIREELELSLALLNAKQERTGKYVVIKLRSYAKKDNKPCNASVAQWNFFALCEDVQPNSTSQIVDAKIQLFGDTESRPATEYVGVVGIKLHCLIASTSEYNNIVKYEVNLFNDKNLSAIEVRKGEKGDYSKGYEYLHDRYLKFIEKNNGGFGGASSNLGAVPQYGAQQTTAPQTATGNNVFGSFEEAVASVAPTPTANATSVDDDPLPF